MDARGGTRRAIATLVALAGAACACPGCGDNQAAVDAAPDAPPAADAGVDAPSDVARPAVTLATYPRIDGSTSTLPMARVIACELFGLGYRWQPDIGPEGTAEIVPVATSPEQQQLADALMAMVVHNRTHEAYLNLIAGQADLILVANPPSPEEVAAADAAGVSLDARPVALDALVILVNAGNWIRGLTADQIRGIYTASFTDWAQVGGPPGPIQPYVRPVNSGSQQLFDAIVMSDLTMPTWPEDRQIRFMGGLVDKIATDPAAIGYSVHYFVTYQYFVPGFRVLPVAGVPAAAGTIATGQYPFVAPVLLVTRTDLDPTSVAAQLRRWLLAPDGQRVVARSGYVPAGP